MNINLVLCKLKNKEGLQMFKSDAIVLIRWYSVIEGGRPTSPSGPKYMANMRFENIAGLWSVVLFIPNEFVFDQQNFRKFEISFMFPENIREYLQKERKIFITEGPNKVVAEGRIVSVLM